MATTITAATLKVTIKEENLLNNALDVGSYLKNKINSLEEKYPAYITNSRGLGLWAAFNLPSMTERDA